MSIAADLAQVVLRTFGDTRPPRGEPYPTLLITVSPGFRYDLMQDPSIHNYIDHDVRRVPDSFCGHGFTIVEWQSQDYIIWVKT